MSKRLYADIAVPSVPKDTLTYAVPEGLQGLEPGMRVMVPLGRRLAMGFVIRTHGVMPDFAVKVVQQQLDAEPVITPQVQALCDWVHHYYHCGLGEALKAALPQGMDVDSERHVSLQSDDEEEIARVVGRSKTRAAIVDALRTGAVMTEAELRKLVDVKSISAQLRDLFMEGIVQVESVIDRPVARPKTVLVARLLPPWNRGEKVMELMDIMERRAPKQVNIVATLWKHYQAGARTVSMAALAKEARASSAQVRALEEKDIVEILEEEVTREWQLRYAEKKKDITLTPAQREVLTAVTAAVDEEKHAGLLLYGVTGSGKTQVYIEAIQHVLGKGKNALVLVPEISLTPQFVYRFRQAFGSDVAVMHSRMSVGERYDAWRLTLAGEYRIVVGVRSAVFAPLGKLGLIVVDEEQEGSYKQSDTAPRYHGRDVAMLRGWFERVPVLLGSATPSAESWYNAVNGKYRFLTLKERIDGAALPHFVFVDIGEERRKQRMRGAFSETLLEGIRQRMAAGEAGIILHNRRGFAPQMECRDCGYVGECENCSITLTYHKDRGLLRCHYCGAAEKAPVICPTCGGTDLDLLGSGTQRVEEDLQEALPEARILRMDSDTTRRRGAHDMMLTTFGEGEADVLLGTQMVAKGLDFDRVTLVGIVAAEQSLRLPDFRATERTAQLLTQVAGRAGRGSRPGTVVLQAQRIEHPVFRRVAANDYTGFMQDELQSRRELYYPPFSRLVLLTFSGENEEAVQDAAKLYHTALGRGERFFAMHPPQPAMLSRINRRYRFQLLLRIEKTRDSDGTRLGAALAKAEEYYLRNVKTRSVHVTVDVDPQHMM
ncbi:MAG: primosomal protein N' [Bacteroidota bacterium]|nr:primosomal protein N' [Bacteroidota bacterium]